MKRGVLAWYSLYAGYFPAESSSEKSELPLKRMINNAHPPIDQLIHSPVALTLNK